jgi:hypothetical protein
MDGPKLGENPRVFLFARLAWNWKCVILCTLLFAGAENTDTSIGDRLHSGKMRRAYISEARTWLGAG